MDLALDRVAAKPSVQVEWMADFAEAGLSCLFGALGGGPVAKLAGVGRVSVHRLLAPGPSSLVNSRASPSRLIVGARPRQRQFLATALHSNASAASTTAIQNSSAPARMQSHATSFRRSIAIALYPASVLWIRRASWKSKVARSKTSSAFPSGANGHGRPSPTFASRG